MTSHDVSRRKLQDPLDAMIRWVLRERAGDATPPPEVWERINERLAHPNRMKTAAWRRDIRLAAEAAVLWVLAVSAVGARTELPHAGLGAGAVWKGSPLCLAEQYGVLLHRLAVL